MKGQKEQGAKITLGKNNMGQKEHMAKNNMGGKKHRAKRTQGKNNPVYCILLWYRGFQQPCNRRESKSVTNLVNYM